ncbi:MAG: hypothetical protein Q4C96_03010 [Planctomycetia bacterium]|nr:hypothetical protein [Planctomycetia bacterium]
MSRYLFYVFVLFLIQFPFLAFAETETPVIKVVTVTPEVEEAIPDDVGKAPEEEAVSEADVEEEAPVVSVTETEMELPDISTAEKTLQDFLSLPENASYEEIKNLLNQLSQGESPAEVNIAISVLSSAGKLDFMDSFQNLYHRLLTHPDASEESQAEALSFLQSIILAKYIHKNLTEEDLENEVKNLPEKWRNETKEYVSWQKKIFDLIENTDQLSLKDIQTLAESGLQGGILNARHAMTLLDISTGPAMLHNSVLQMPAPKEIQDFINTVSSWEPKGKFTLEEKKTFLANLELYLRTSEWSEVLFKLHEIKEAENAKEAAEREATKETEVKKEDETDPEASAPVEEKEVDAVSAYIQEHRAEIEKLIVKTEETLNRLTEEKNLQLSGSSERFLMFVPGSILTYFPEKYPAFRKSFENMIQNCPMNEIPEPYRESIKEQMKKSLPPEHLPNEISVSYQ